MLAQKLQKGGTLPLRPNSAIWVLHDLPNLGSFGADQHAQASVCELLKADPTPKIRDKSRQDGQTSTNLLFAFAIHPRSAERTKGPQNRADEVCACLVMAADSGWVV